MNGLEPLFSFEILSKEDEMAVEYEGGSLLKPPEEVAFGLESETPTCAC